MEAKGALSRKVGLGKSLLVIAILAIPGFFWFRYLYYQYVVIPDQVSPEMAKMRDAIMHRPSTGAADRRPGGVPKALAHAHKSADEKGGGKAAP